MKKILKILGHYAKEKIAVRIYNLCGGLRIGGYWRCRVCGVEADLYQVVENKSHINVYLHCDACGSYQEIQYSKKGDSDKVIINKRY